MNSTDRLGVIDEMFLRSHRGLGTPIAIQGLWRSPQRVDIGTLTDLHSAFRVGPLGRRPVRPRVPGARPWWQINTLAYPPPVAADPMAQEEILDWADGQADDLGPADGPGWRLSAAYVDGGGTVISLSCSHALADARGVAVAVGQALSDCSAFGNSASGNPASGNPAFGNPVHESDFADARRQWATVLSGSARAVAGLVRHPSRRSDLRRRRFTRTVAPLRVRPPTVILQFPAGPWERVAAQHGGTANSLFVAVVSNILWRSGFTLPVLDVSLPVETRSVEVGGNAMSMSEVTVTHGDSLVDIRRNCRTAYSARMSSPGGFPEELLQVVGPRVAHALSRGAGERDALCSNIGTLPAPLSRIGPYPTSGIATRAIHPGLTTDRLAQLRTRLSGYLCRVGDDYTLSLVGLDPEHVDSSERLRELAFDELGQWGLTARSW